MRDYGQFYQGHRGRHDGDQQIEGWTIEGFDPDPDPLDLGTDDDLNNEPLSDPIELDDGMSLDGNSSFDIEE